ncbi:MAG: MOSC domain-containing protein [Rhizomicrobium sp.]|jgi:MOSC domain-containing protein YiiM
MTGARFSILSVNAGLPEVIYTASGEAVLSGIAKRVVAANSVLVRALGIEGDGQADLEAHGGVDKAVYAYPSDHWPWWETEKKLTCAPNSFGDNLTLAGGDESLVRIGDRFRWGEAILEISQPRAPCFKLAIHTKRPDVPQAMILSARCGWYLRMIAEGAAPTRGATLVRIAASDGPTVRESFVALFSPTPDRDALRRIHDAPALSAAWRHSINKKIAALRG